MNSPLVNVMLKISTISMDYSNSKIFNDEWNTYGKIEFRKPLTCDMLPVCYWPTDSYYSNDGAVKYEYAGTLHVICGPNLSTNF